MTTADVKSQINWQDPLEELGIWNSPLSSVLVVTLKDLSSEQAKEVVKLIDENATEPFNSGGYKYPEAAIKHLERVVEAGPEFTAGSTERGGDTATIRFFRPDKLRAFAAFAKEKSIISNGKIFDTKLVSESTIFLDSLGLHNL